MSTPSTTELLCIRSPDTDFNIINIQPNQLFIWKSSSTPNSKFPTELQVPNHTNMASMPFSATFSTPLHGYSQTKTTTSSNSSASYSSMAFWTPSVKSSLGSSKSAIFQNGFSLKSPSFNGVFFKARSLGVYARAATQKTLYDFSVKVYRICSWKNLLFSPFP